ncbi:YigZ family protein [Flavobacterium endoglycinae]|uniref:YigZ family protein n=1 Tax=Flavobacterium endoglycinae TaxID=2816357 RepID=A0ABX7QAQ6_9FLAO|nr:YigZ family protein [Flavobacterium endoglycinae]QSW87764.1 YigZ family protein [Flavobacterium endoglycinae]
MEINDTYQTIAFESEEVLFKEKGSKFFGYAYPIESEEEVKPIIENLRKLHPHAVHYCYAYQLGTAPKISYRANDDGEPSNTAGAPIYGQIQSFGVTNVLVVVVRIFGGIKLGVGGLISAYRTTAQMTLEICEIIEKTIDVQFIISFDYKNMNKVMRVIKEKKLEITSQEMEMDENTGQPIGKIITKTRKKNAESIFDIFDLMFEIDIKII